VSRRNVGPDQAGAGDPGRLRVDDEFNLNVIYRMV
jgi:hypothetical protein